jgi:hypothetical protein
MKLTAIHPKTVAKRKLLTVFICLPVRVLQNEDTPSRRRLNDLYGHDFRRIVVPLGTLGFLKSGCFAASVSASSSTLNTT